jgi:hypothetical protein
MKTNEQITQELRRSSAALLKLELMERYGLRADQVNLQVTISTDDLALGRQILKDFDKYEGSNHLDDHQPCDQVYGTDIHFVWVHRKDGYYGRYVTEGENNES